MTREGSSENAGQDQHVFEKKSRWPKAADTSKNIKNHKSHYPRFSVQIPQNVDFSDFRPFRPNPNFVSPSCPTSCQQLTLLETRFQSTFWPFILCDFLLRNLCLAGFTFSLPYERPYDVFLGRGLIFLDFLPFLIDLYYTLLL